MKDVFDGGFGDCGNPAIAIHIEYDLSGEEKKKFIQELKEYDPKAWEGFLDYLKFRKKTHILE